MPASLNLLLRTQRKSRATPWREDDRYLWFDTLQGVNTNQVERLEQSVNGVDLATASNVLPDPLGELVTREGFSHVRATALTGAPAITGLFYMGPGLTDKLIIADADGDINLDDANPPTDIAGGTDFTAGANVLVRGEVFNDLLILVSNERNLPRTVNASGVGADLGGTPARGLDVKAFGRRLFMASPIYSAVTYRHLVSFTSADDNQAAWTNPVTTNSLTLGRVGSNINVVGLEVYDDFLMGFTENSVFPIRSTPNATIPFNFQKDILAEDGGGPPNAHSVIKANNRLYWLSKNFDVKVMEGLDIRSVSAPKYAIQNTLKGLNDARRIYTIGFWEPKYRLACWAVSDGSDTTNQDVIAMQVDTGWFYFFTLSVNAACLRTVSGELRCLIGHYNGLFSNLFDGSTTGDLQTAASAIDAIFKTPRHHLGLPGIMKLTPPAIFEFDPISAETVTIRTYYDDATSADETMTAAISGTDIDAVEVPLTRPYDRVQFEVEDAASGERFRCLRYGIPRPTLTYPRKSF